MYIVVLQAAVDVAKSLPGQEESAGKGGGVASGNTRRSSTRVADKAASRGGAVEPDFLVQNVGRAGKGLFVVGYIPKPGYVVARMGTSVKAKRRVAKRHVRELGLPHDACIDLQGGDFSYFDHDFIDRDHTPDWYYMNHACKHNCRMIIRAGVVCWITTRSVQNEELSFKYDEPQPAWCVCEAGCFAEKWHHS